MLILPFIIVIAFLINEINAASVLSEAIDYTIFKSKIYPDYGVRYISPTLCDPNVTQVHNTRRLDFKLCS